MDVKVRIYIQISIPKINQETQKKRGGARKHWMRNRVCYHRSVDHVCEKLQPKSSDQFARGRNPPGCLASLLARKR